MGLCHALHRWLSGLLMSNHDTRFSGRQKHRRDLCTNVRHFDRQASGFFAILAGTSEREITENGQGARQPAHPAHPL